MFLYCFLIVLLIVCLFVPLCKQDCQRILISYPRRRKYRGIPGVTHLQVIGQGIGTRILKPCNKLRVCIVHVHDWYFHCITNVDTSKTNWVTDYSPPYGFEVNWYPIDLKVDAKRGRSIDWSKNAHETCWEIELHYIRSDISLQWANMFN